MNLFHKRAMRTKLDIYVFITMSCSLLARVINIIVNGHRFESTHRYIHIYTKVFRVKQLNNQMRKTVV